MDEENKNNLPPEGEGEGSGTPTGTGVASDIGARLSKKEAGEGSEKSNEGGFEEGTPLPFDLAKLNKEQLQTLKSMLAATPDAPQRKKAKPTIKLRQVEGKLVIDFKNAFLGVVKDVDLNRDVERHIIPVKFLGETEFANVLYKKFIESPQVVCEVISSRHEDDELIEGQTVSRETGTLVDMIRKSVKYWFTVKLPEGSNPETVEIEARLANA